MDEHRDYIHSPTCKSILLRALVFAAIIALILAVPQIFTDIPPKDAWPQQLDSTSTSGTMIVMGPLLALWILSIYIRCSDLAIRRYLMLMSSFFLMWLLIVLLKYPTGNDLLVSLYWYLFYIPMLFAPLLCLFSALRAASLDGIHAIRIIKHYALGISCILVALVLSNNLHHLVFVFDFENSQWIHDYTYNLGYWIILSWIALVFISFFCVLFFASQKQMRSTLAPAFIVASLGILYCILYIFRIVPSMLNNLSLTYILFVISGLELCFAFGLLPSCLWYKEVFRKLPLDLKLLTYEYKVELATECARPLDRSEREKLTTSSPTRKHPITFKSSEQETYLSKAYAISGGIVLFNMDITPVLARRKQLTTTQALLSQKNLMLHQTHALQKKLHQQYAEQILFEEIESAISPTISKIKTILSQISSDTSLSKKQHQKKLIQIKILLSLCKRKGALVLIAKNSPAFGPDQLQLALDESSIDFQAAGIDCAMQVKLNMPLGSTIAIALFDCLYDIALIAISYDSPVALFYLHDNTPSHITLEVLLEFSLYRKETETQMLEDFCKSLHNRTLTYELTESSDYVKLTILAERSEQA